MFGKEIRKKFNSKILKGKEKKDFCVDKDFKIITIKIYNPNDNSNKHLYKVDVQNKTVNTSRANHEIINCNSLENLQKIVNEITSLQNI